MKVFFDIETSGFSISKNGVCEIAMIITDNSLNSLHEYHALIKPYTQEHSAEYVIYKPEAMAVHDITIEQLQKDGQEVQAVTQEIVELLNNWKVQTMIGHNSISFDVPRLDYLLSRFQNRTIKQLYHQDTMKMAKERLTVNSYSLQNLCAVFGITNEKTHSAMGDVRATIELYKKLSGIV